MRQIVLDTETTGLEYQQGHKIIEIGCVELINRRLTGHNYHQYINPEREVDAGAYEVHGLDNKFLQDKPLFSTIVDEFIDFIGDDELIIHNAPFDVGFLDNELKLLNTNRSLISDTNKIVDSLKMARYKHPGQSNKLDALCRRYYIDNSHRTLHGALLDAEILAEVYLAMTGGQVTLGLGDEDGGGSEQNDSLQHRAIIRNKLLPVLTASSSENQAHDDFLKMISESSGETISWPLDVSKLK
jgi:DNA polymerase III subunit epsilon